jgi:5-methylcytosine-specific restriction protein A
MPTIKLLNSKRDSVPTRRKREYQEIYQDRRWTILRKAKMRSNPLCELHEFRGKVVPMQEVHHKTPFQEGKSSFEIEELAYDWDNLESLCCECHEERHKKLRQ